MCWVDLKEMGSVLYGQNRATHSYPYKHEHTEPLVDAHAGENITPIFLARTVPKWLSNLTHYLRYRILLVRLLERDLNVDDKERISQIEKDLQNLCKGADDPIKAFIHSYIRANFLISIVKFSYTNRLRNALPGLIWLSALLAPVPCSKH